MEQENNNPFDAYKKKRFNASSLIPSRKQFWLFIAGAFASLYIWDYMTKDKQKQIRNEEILEKNRKQEEVRDFYKSQREIEERWANPEEGSQVPKHNHFDSLKVKEGEPIDLDGVDLGSFIHNIDDITKEPPELLEHDAQNNLAVVGHDKTAYFIPCVLKS